MAFVIGSVRAGALRRWQRTALVAAIAATVASWGLAAGGPALAAESSVGLGTATPFAVLAGTTVTNTGPSVISGDLGVYPGSAVTGFPPGQVRNGTQHAADAVASASRVRSNYGLPRCSGADPSKCGVHRPWRADPRRGRLRRPPPPLV